MQIIDENDRSGEKYKQEQVLNSTKTEYEGDENIENGFCTF